MDFWRQLFFSILPVCALTFPCLPPFTLPLSFPSPFTFLSFPFVVSFTALLLNFPSLLCSPFHFSCPFPFQLLFNFLLFFPLLCARLPSLSFYTFLVPCFCCFLFPVSFPSFPSLCSPPFVQRPLAKLLLETWTVNSLRASLMHDWFWMSHHQTATVKCNMQ